MNLWVDVQVQMTNTTLRSTYASVPTAAHSCIVLSSACLTPTVVLWRGVLGGVQPWEGALPRYRHTGAAPPSQKGRETTAAIAKPTAHVSLQRDWGMWVEKVCRNCPPHVAISDLLLL